MNPQQKWVILVIVYLLFFLIGLGALGAVLGFFENADADFRRFAIAVLFADIVGATIAVFRTQFQLGDFRAHVNLQFQGKQPKEVRLEHCEYEIRDGQNEIKKKGQAVVRKGPGGWQCSFTIEPGVVEYGHVRLTLTEQDKTVWHVPSFSLNTLSAEAERASP